MTRVIAFFVAALAMTSSACSRGPAASESAPRMLVGAGATLPYPLYSKWAADYALIDPTMRINYQSIGSGAGVRQIGDGVLDFGATDAPMSEDQLLHAPRPLVQVPTTIGAVVFAFNLPAGGELALTAEIAADIFLGRITRWDDSRLVPLNGGHPLPDAPILVVHRADGSGTSAALTGYLAKHSEAWRLTVGAGTSPRFPVGVGAKGNEGVAAFVKATPLSIGYVELVYARQSKLPMARMKNHYGAFVAPTIDAVERAARSAVAAAKTGERIDLTDAADEGAYPLTALSYVVVPKESREREKGEALAKFLWWAIHDGQGRAHEMEYAPLPPVIVGDAERALLELRCDGRPLLPPRT